MKICYILISYFNRKILMIRQKIFFILILSICCCMQLLGQIVVNQSGSIQLAIDLAVSGDTVIVEKGIYTEFDIVIKKPLTIIGVDYPIVDAQEKGFVFDITADSVTISGFKLINVGKSYIKDYSAIHAFKVNHFSIVNNLIQRESWHI